jgi:hypothetical protein
MKLQPRGARLPGNARGCDECVREELAESRMKAWMRYEQAFVWVATIVVVLMVLGATAFFALDFNNQR